MPDTNPPSLGYGQRDGAPIDAVNQWFRSTPQYQAKLAQMGVDPNNVRLNDQQKQELIRLAQSLGVVVDEGHDGQEIDESGNFRAKGHKLRNTLIVAGIAGAALATMGAAGVFAGGAGAASGAASGAGAAAAGGASATSAGAGLAGLAGIEGGAAGLGEGALAALGTGAMGAVPVGAAAAGAGAAAAGGAFDAAGNFIGDTTISSIAPAGGALTTADRLASLAGKVGGITNGISTAITGQDPALAGTGAANAAAQAARNRIDAARVDQGGPAADKTALSNMRTAGLMANFAGAPASDYGSPAINLGQGTKDMAAAFQAEILKRQAAGKSLTASGVPDPTAQELADEQKARDIAAGGSGVPGTAGRIINGVNTGTRLAQLAPSVIRGARDIWSMF